MNRLVATPLNLYVLAVAIIGVAVVSASALGLLGTPHFREWGALSLLALVASRFPLRVPGTNAWFSIADTFYITSALLFGPAPATVTMAVDSMVMSLRHKWGPRRLVFNAAAPAIAFWTGAQLFMGLSDTGPLFGDIVNADALMWPLLGFTATYFVLNSGLTALAVALDKGAPASAVFRSHFGLVSLSWFAAGSTAFLLVLFSQYVSLLALAAVLPLIAVIHLAMRSWTGRIADAEQHVATVDRLYLSTIGALSTAIEAKDGVTSNHIHRVQHYAMGLAKALGGLDEQTCKALQAAALLHDTGKLAVPERILNKPGKLTAAEFEAMKLHVDVGADILSSIDFPYPVVPIVRAHHENWDGSGYPNGLKGIDIPIGARILSVVDCYDALTSDRPYRAAMTDEDALAIIRARRGTMYDPVIVDTFERVCRDIAPATVKPQLQKAIEKISRAVASTPAEPAAVAPAVAEGPESLRALAHLARVVSGRSCVADVASLIWSHVRHLVPNVSCAFYVSDPTTDSLTAAFVEGPAASMLQGATMRVGDRLTGWVAANQQAIVNSDAALDLGREAALLDVRCCVALPLVSDGELAGVLSLYSAEALRDDQVQMLQFVTPHLALMLTAVKRRVHSEAAVTPRSAPRVLSMFS
ncbi:MAG TPA: HD domain-containing phosphohydrolase [Vicinamibacterales bacterium]|nr:HD domain-containing phosphohydrolase [Vicinamibacterales bacterium]